MTVAKSKFDPEPDWISIAQEQARLGRYNSGDERGARFMSLSPKGSMARLAIKLAVKAWSCRGKPNEGSFVSSSKVLEMLDEGAFEHCETAPDQWWSDPNVTEGGLGVWLLTEHAGRSYTLLLTRCYPDLQAARREELSKKSFAAGIRKPKTPRRTLRTRTDTL
jgi:hypothetical protein